MIYENTLLLKNQSKYKLSISTFKNGINTETEENALPYKYAKNCYNYIFNRGALETGLGFNVLKFPETKDGDQDARTMEFLSEPSQIKKIWLFPFYDNTAKVKVHMIVVSADNQVQYARIIGYNNIFTNVDWADILTFTSDANALYYNIDGEDVMLLTSATDGMFVFYPKYNTNTLDTIAPKITSMCRHYERVFAIEEGKRNKLVFSANLDPTNWDISIDDAGYIELIDDRGGLERVVSFNDYVYIFKEYGISRLSAYGDQSEFSLSSLFVSSGKIYGNSVCVCGDRIMFLSRDGIYSFNGYTTTKLSLHIESMFDDINNEYCCSAYHNGKYYLGCKLDYNDSKTVGCESYSGGYINNTLIELDLKNGDINLTRGVDLRNLCAVEYETVSKLVASFNNEHKSKLGQMTHDGKIFGTPLEKSWVSPKSNLGHPNKAKKVKELSLISKYDCSVTIKTDKEEKTFAITGSDKTQTICPSVSGEMLQFSFDSAIADAHIAVPEITVGVSK